MWLTSKGGTGFVSSPKLDEVFTPPKNCGLVSICSSFFDSPNPVKSVWNTTFQRGIPCFFSLKGEFFSLLPLFESESVWRDVTPTAGKHVNVA